MINGPIVVSAIAGSGVSFLLVAIFNLVREAHRRSAGQRSRRVEIWE
jgi:hypothetical protein